MADALAALCERFDASYDDTLLSWGEEQGLTYGEVWSEASDLADQWGDQGVEQGSPIAIMFANDPRFLVCYLACFIGGYVAVPVNVDLPETDIDYILDLVKPSLVLDETPAVPAKPVPRPVRPLNGDASKLAAIFFTSGTTGRPKGVRHSLNALVGNVSSFNAQFGLDARTVLYHMMPMAYMAGFLNTFLSPLMAGGKVVVGPKFSTRLAMGFWQHIADTDANAIWMSPSMAASLVKLSRDLDKARAAATQLKRIFCGTAPLHIAVRESFASAFAKPLQESYGTSELLLIAAQDTDDAKTQINVGTVLPELDISQSPYQEDQTQFELVVRSPFAYLGYLTDEGELPPERTPEGYVRTGDVGKVEAGRLHITGRLKDIIIRGGVNISPITLENLLSNLPGVTDVAVIGVAHSFWGESICVCLETNGDQPHDALEQSVRKRCREHLPQSHQPDKVAFFDAFPRAVTGKVQKNVLLTKVSE